MYLYFTYSICENDIFLSSEQQNMDFESNGSNEFWSSKVWAIWYLFYDNDVQLRNLIERDIWAHV